MEEPIPPLVAIFDLRALCSHTSVRIACMHAPQTDSSVADPLCLPTMAPKRGRKAAPTNGSKTDPTTVVGHTLRSKVRAHFRTHLVQRCCYCNTAAPKSKEACMRACMHACMHACMRACVRACMRVRACVRACMHACLHACVHACVRACARACMHAFIICMHVQYVLLEDRDA